MGSLFLSPGSLYTRFCLLCSPRVYFPVLCKFWPLYSGFNGDLLQEDLCHTHIQNPCPCGRALLTHTFHRRCSNTVLSQSLWGPWVLVCTRFVWALWASLAGMGFDSKCEFAPPTILLGLPFALGCGVSPHSNSSPYLLTGVFLTLKVGYLLKAAAPDLFFPSLHLPIKTRKGYDLQWLGTGSCNC